MSATTSGLARRSAGRRGRLYAYRRALLALFALGCTSGEAAELADGARGAAAKWHACQVSADCTWTLGEGGWPAAVSGSSVSAHQEWVESQAPFTTYFMPGDCFAHNEEFEAYVSRSRSSVACRAGACTLEVEPACSK